MRELAPFAVGGGIPLPTAAFRLLRPSAAHLFTYRENGVPALLTLVDHHPENSRNRLRLALAHLQAAIAHINNESQARITSDTKPSDLEQLRLVVCALHDVIVFLKDESSTSRSATRHAVPEASPPPGCESQTRSDPGSP